MPTLSKQPEPRACARTSPETLTILYWRLPGIAYNCLPVRLNCRSTVEAVFLGISMRAVLGRSASVQSVRFCELSMGSGEALKDYFSLPFMGSGELWPLLAGSDWPVSSLRRSSVPCSGLHGICTGNCCRYRCACRVFRLLSLPRTPYRVGLQGKSAKAVAGDSNPLRPMPCGCGGTPRSAPSKA